MAAATTAVTALILIAAGCGSSSTGGASGPSGGGGGTVTVGESTTLSGAIADLGQTGLDGVQLAAADLNAHGGVLGKKITVVSADDAATPATGAANARSMVLSQHVAALFGPVSSAVAAAEEQVAAQYRVPVFFHTSNDIGLMTTHFTKYAFQNVPNTVMEPRAVAAYLARQVGHSKVTIATFAPDYSFGHDTVAAFLKALTDLHVSYRLVQQEFPPLGATSISSYLSALESAHPQYVFNAQFGGDLVAFTKQAQGYGFFARTKVIAMYAYSPLQALGTSAPGGAIGFDRAPFWAISGPRLAAFVAEFHAKYGQYPSEWAILGYSAVQEWAYAVTKARTFSADAVAAALPGATVPTIIGPVTIRACDHQAELPEYVGVVAAAPDPRFGGAMLWQPGAFTAPFSQIALSCAQTQVLAQQG